MRRSGATAPGTMRTQNAAELTPDPRIVCSTVLPSRITRNSLKTNDRDTLYPSQNRKAFFRASVATSAREAYLRKALAVVSEAGKS